MKYLIAILALSAAPMLAHAEEKLDAHKAEITQNLDKRIASLQTMKSCIQGASAQEGIKACREAHQKEMDAIKDANIDSKIQKLQERKAKRGNREKQ